MWYIWTTVFLAHCMLSCILSRNANNLLTQHNIRSTIGFAIIKLRERYFMTLNSGNEIQYSLIAITIRNCFNSWFNIPYTVPVCHFCIMFHIFPFGLWIISVLFMTFVDLLNKYIYYPFPIQLRWYYIPYIANFNTSQWTLLIILLQVIQVLQYLHTENVLWKLHLLHRL